MGKSKIARDRLAARYRSWEALQLRKAGATYEEIGRALGMTRTGAYRAVKRALDELNEKIAEDAAEVLRLELERLDAMLLAVWPKAKQGHLGAIDRVLKIMERRSRLLGLDAPHKVDQKAEIVFRWEDTEEAGDVA